MKNAVFFLAAAILTFALAIPQAPARGDGLKKEPPSDPPALIRNHTVWRDTKGNLIDCHEGGLLRVGSKYYWYGRIYHGNEQGIYGTAGAKFRCGFDCYSSPNLVDWTFEGPILSYPASGRLTEGTWHRPRVIYNEKTSKYVLWFFCLGTPPGRGVWVNDVIAISDHPAGPFTVSDIDRKVGFDPSGDLALLNDGDGRGYIANGDRRLNGLVSRLSDDFQSVTGDSVIALPAGDNRRFEGLSMAHFKGKYIVAGSGVVGLDPSDTTYAVADAPLGPYKLKGLMSEQKTWHSQISSFYYLPETDTLFALCEQWLTGPNLQVVPAEQSSQLWLPVTFDPATGVAKMKYCKEWNPKERQN